MPIDTLIEGEPASIRAASSWLKAKLAVAVDDCVTELHRARDSAHFDWQGSAGSAFTARMQSGSTKANGLRDDIERAARSFDAYADDLQTAQAGMERARSIAAGAGLACVNHLIQEPASVPSVAALPAGRAPTAAETQTYRSGMAAIEDHERKILAYTAAEEEARRSRALLDSAQTIGKSTWDDLSSKALLHAADLVNGAVIGGLLAAHVGVLRKHAGVMLKESEKTIQHYLAAPGGSAQAKALNNQAFEKFLQADEANRQASAAGSRIGSKIPVIGLGITAAGVGYDIHEGKPVGKAVVSGIGGAVAAAWMGASAGAMIGGPWGAAAGALVGLGSGLIASGALDWGYDRLPPGTKASIEEGFSEIGDAIGGAGAAVGDNAKKAWNAIF